jgi:Cu-Zn family superoxide dismutase
LSTDFQAKDYTVDRGLAVGFPIAVLLFAAACTQNASQQSAAPAQQQTSAAEAHEHASAEQGETMEGFAIALAPTQGSQTTGTVMVMSMGEGVHFSGVLAGLEPGRHAIHIHEKGDCGAPDGSSAGGHFNPGNTNHGAPGSLPHHAGDLGNIEAGKDGRAEINVHADFLTVEPGERSVLGKAFIVHAAADDLRTQPTGNAGARVACGAIVSQ